MSVPKIRAEIYRLQNSNFTTLISNSSSSLLVPLQKCCKSDQLYSVDERNCVSHQNSMPRLNASKFEIKYDFACLYPEYWYTNIHSSQIQQFFHDGSADVLLDGEKKPHRLNDGEYCLDVDKDSSSILITCDQLLPIRPTYSVCLWLYLASLLLAVTTFSFHLAVPKLRAKVKDKCFICYLACLIFWMLVYADVWGLTGINLLKKCVGINAAFGLESYSIMVSSSWVNVMCIHLWRTVTTVNSIPPRSFYVYVSYAMGLPAICRILFQIDLLISGPYNFSNRAKKGAGPFSNPVLLYMVDVCSIQLIINIGILFRVGYIIWNQKQRWNGQDNHGSMKHHYRRKRMFSQLLRLFIIMHMEWIYIFAALYCGIERMDNPLLGFRFWVKIYLGYFIFILYFCCNKYVISSMRKRFSKKSHEIAVRSSQNNLSISLTPTIPSL